MRDYSYQNEGQLWILLKGLQNTCKKIKSWFIFSSSSGTKYGGYVVLDQTTKKSTCRDSNKAPQQYNPRTILYKTAQLYVRSDQIIICAGKWCLLLLSNRESYHCDSCTTLRSCYLYIKHGRCKTVNYKRTMNYVKNASLTE